jgi:hypothetical protein
MRKLAFVSILMCLIVAGRVSAESTIESLGVPGNVECDAFMQSKDGSWTLIRKSIVTIGSNRLAVDGPITFEKEGTSRKAVAVYVAVGSYDLADVLLRTCSERR